MAQLIFTIKEHNMPKYRNTELSVRSPQIIIHNPDQADNPQAAPVIDFMRELVIEVAGERGKKQLSTSRVIYTADNINTEVPVLDPETDEVIEGETITYSKFYQYFYSIFAKVSTDQDAQDMAREQMIALANAAGMPHPGI